MGLGGGGLTVKQRRRWRCLTKTSEAGVFHCLGVVEASPVKEGGEGCAQVWTREREGGKRAPGGAPPFL
jgi:hypothetical protein